MELIYEGVDITKEVRIVSAVCRDASGGKSDSLELVLGDAEKWYGWKPQQDDKILLRREGYSTGTMYLSAVQPEEGEFRILATAQPMAARRKANKSYEDMTLETIMGLCAAECGMRWRLYGIDGGIRYRYLLRTEESCAALLDRLAGLEGAVLKCWDGQLTMIGIAKQQAAAAVETIRVTARQPGAVHTDRARARLRQLTVATPWVQVSARDTGGSGELSETQTPPAADAATAGRWARGLLLCRNRQAEKLTVHSRFRAEWTAMLRADVTGGTTADGKWLMDEVEHDFVAGTSRVTLVRCIETIG